MVSLYEMGSPQGGNMQFIDKNTAPDPSPICLKWHDQLAHNCYKAFSQDCQDRMEQSPEDAPFIARCAEIAIRCATILACGCSMTPTLKLEHMEWGCALAAQSADGVMTSARDHMTETLGVADFERKLIKMLRAAPGRMMTLRQIGNSMSKNQRNSYDLIAMIESLKKTDRVVEQDKGPTGQRGRFIRLI
jgi:hypothetical protein